MTDKKTDIPREVMEAAGEWFDILKQEPVADDDRQAFVDWFMRSPVHVEEFIRVSALHDHLSSELKSQPEWLANIIDQAGTNIVNINDFEQQHVAYEEKTTKQRWIWMKAVASIAFVGMLIGVIAGITDIYQESENIEVITTKLGEQHSVLMDDGSVVQLNTNTKIHININSTVRHVDLIKGEAIFQVAKDPARPFRVAINSVIVEAIGTVFNIYRQEEQIIVTVVEGLVGVTPATNMDSASIQPNKQYLNSQKRSEVTKRSESSDSVLELAVGYQLAISNDGMMLRSQVVDVNDVTAWTQRRLVFDNDTLKDIVNEFNRYNRDSLIVTDPTLNTRRITGVFNANDSEAFIVLLQSLGNIRIEKGVDGSRQVSRLYTQ